MSTQSTPSSQQYRRQYFIKSDALSRNQHQSNYFNKMNSESSVDETIKVKGVPNMNPRTNDLPGILALALRESSIENNSPVLPKSERSYFELGKSLRRISLSQSGVRIDKSLENSCVAADCPNRHIRVHYEELKNEYNEKVREIRRLTKLLEVGDNRESIKNNNKPANSSEAVGESEVVARLRNEIETLNIKNKSLDNDLNYADVMMEKIKTELSKKEEMLTYCQSYTDDQLRYIESTTKPSYNTKRDSIKNIKAQKATILEYEKSNKNLKAQNIKLLKDIEDLKNSYAVLSAKFEKSEASRLKSSGVGDAKVQDKHIKELTNEKHMLIEDIRMLKDAQKKSMKVVEEKLAVLESNNENLSMNLKFQKEDSSKLKQAYEKLLKMTNELEAANTALKAQFKDQKHKSDTLDREKENLGEEMEVLKAKYVSCTKEKAEIEKRLFELNKKVYEIFHLISTDEDNTVQVDFNTKPVEIIKESELTILKTHVMKYLSLRSNHSVTERKEESQVTCNLQNPFHTASGSMSEQRIPNDGDKSLITRFITFVSSVKQYYNKSGAEGLWFESTASDLLSCISSLEQKIEENHSKLENFQESYIRLKEDHEKTAHVLNSLIDSLNVDIKRKTKVWTSFLPANDQSNYNLVCRLTQALQLYATEMEEDYMRQSHRSEEIPSPTKQKQPKSHFKNDTFDIRPMSNKNIIKQKESEKIFEPINSHQLMLLSHLMSNKESESITSDPHKPPLRDKDRLIDALKAENDHLRKQVIKLEAQDQSLSKTNDAIMLNLPPKGLMSDENYGVDAEKLQNENEQLRYALEAAINENEALRHKLIEASVAFKVNGVFKGSNDVYDMVNQTNFFPNKTSNSDGKTKNEFTETENSRLQFEDQGMDQPQAERRSSGFTSKRPIKTNTVEYDDGSFRYSRNKDGTEHSELESNKEYYAEFEDENDLRDFIEALINSHKAKVEELEAELEEIRFKMNEMEVENKNLRMEFNGDSKLREELEYYRVKVASLELANKLANQSKNSKGESVPVSDRRKTRSEEEALEALKNEFRQLEALNNELSANVFRQTEALERFKENNRQLRAELEEVRGRCTVSGFMQNNSDLLNSEIYHLNLSDLNPNKAVAQTVQNQVASEDVLKLKDRALHFEESYQNALIELETLKVKIANLERENLDLKKNRAELQKQVELLVYENNQQLGQYTEMKSKILDSKNSLIGAMDQLNLENDIKRLQTQTLNLNETIFKLTKANDQLMAEGAEISAENKALIDERRKLTSQLYRLSAKSMHKDSELEKKTFKLSNALIQVAALKSELERLVFTRN